MDTLTQLSNRLRATQEAADADAIDRLTRAYLVTFGRVEPFIDGLAEWLEANPDATTDQLKRSTAYRNLMASINEELNDYEAIYGNVIEQAATESAQAGLTGGQALLLAALALALGIDDVPADVLENPTPDALDFLAAYLARNGELYQRIDALSSYHAEQIAAGILERVGLGQNPRNIAAWITDAFGMPLTDALRTARTAQLYSYRQAESAHFVANADMLEGVMWSAELDDRVCMSCVSLHGQMFPVGTIANDHHNGRCAMIPIVKGAKSPIETNGLDWFAAQDETRQKSMLGASAFDAWQDGKFDLSQISHPYNDPVYGEMRREASLKDLLE